MVICTGSVNSVERWPRLFVDVGSSVFITPHLPVYRLGSKHNVATTPAATPPHLPVYRLCCKYNFMTMSTTPSSSDRTREASPRPFMLPIPNATHLLRRSVLFLSIFTTA